MLVFVVRRSPASLESPALKPWLIRRALGRPRPPAPLGGSFPYRCRLIVKPFPEMERPLQRVIRIPILPRATARAVYRLAVLVVTAMKITATDRHLKTFLSGVGMILPWQTSPPPSVCIGTPIWIIGRRSCWAIPVLTLVYL